MNAVKEAPRTKGTAEQGTEMAKAAEAVTPRRAHVTPFTFMGRLADEMDRLFEDFGFESHGFWPQVWNRGRELAGHRDGPTLADWTPRIESFERAGHFVVRVELPGMTPEDVKIETGKDRITLRGERKREKHEEREGYYYGECRYGAFYRDIPLPEGVDTSKATAELRKGVLEVVMPRKAAPEAEARRLEIREVQ